MLNVHVGFAGAVVGGALPRMTLCVCTNAKEHTSTWEGKRVSGWSISRHTRLQLSNTMEETLVYEWDGGCRGRGIAVSDAVRACQHKRAHGTWVSKTGSERVSVHACMHVWQWVCRRQQKQGSNIVGTQDRNGRCAT